MDLFYSNFNSVVGDGIRRRVTVSEDVFNHSRALGVLRPLFDATQLTSVTPPAPHSPAFTPSLLNAKTRTRSRRICVSIP